MDIFRDLLDKQLVDRHGRNMGKIDGLIAEVRDDQPPRITHMEVGAVTLSRRVSRRLSNRIAKWFGRNPEAGAFQIPWNKIRDLSIDIRLDLDAEKIPTLAVENWLRKKVICRIPGA
jgi:hypothetical protein